MKILITGFDPFGSDKINPSYEAVKLLPDKILGATIIKAEVLTVAYKSIDLVCELIDKHQVDVVINVGQAGGRFTITPEKVAINLNDFRIKDNQGNQYIDEAIYKDGENAYFTTLPIKSIVNHLVKNNIPASVSYSAGTFVCNHLMYGVLHYINKNDLNIRAGFIHIPYMNEQVLNKKNQPAMSLLTLASGLEKIVEAVILNENDLNVVGGDIC